MALLPRLCVILSLMVSPATSLAMDCNRVLAHLPEMNRDILLTDEAAAAAVMRQLKIHLRDPHPYLQRMSIQLSDIDWSTAKLLVAEDFWMEYLVTYQGERVQLKVYFLNLIPETKGEHTGLRSDLAQMVVQSILADLKMARPILRIIPPLHSEQLAHQLRRFGLIDEEKGDHIYFGALFPYFDSYQTVIIPELVFLPKWFDDLGRPKVRAEIMKLERALSRIGIIHGHNGYFFVSSDGNVVLADFDYLRGTGFDREKAGLFSSIFVRPSDDVVEIFGKD